MLGCLLCFLMHTVTDQFHLLYHKRYSHLAYPTNKEILNENQQKKYCYTFPLRLKVLFGKLHFKSFYSLCTLQLMAFTFRNLFCEQSALIYGNPINQFLKFVILKMTWESLLEVNLYTMVYRDFENMWNL